MRCAEEKPKPYDLGLQTHTCATDGFSKRPLFIWNDTVKPNEVGDLSLGWNSQYSFLWTVYKEGGK